MLLPGLRLLLFRLLLRRLLFRLLLRLLLLRVLELILLLLRLRRHPLFLLRERLFRLLYQGRVLVAHTVRRRGADSVPQIYETVSLSPKRHIDRVA